MNDPTKRARRCLCHKAVIRVERDAEGNVVKRICMATHKVITRDKTYLSTWGSDEEVTIDPGPEVQRGAPLN